MGIGDSLDEIIIFFIKLIQNLGLVINWYTFSKNPLIF